MLHLLGGVYLGWSLGANNAANVFGTAVTSKMLRFTTAGVLGAGFILLGAVLEGRHGIETIGGLASQNLETATLCAVGAAVSITVMTLLRIPSSTSQAVVGAIIGIGLVGARLHLGDLPKVLICWALTPVGALVVAAGLYRLSGWGLNRARLDLYSHDRLMRVGLLVAGCYGAYALGANNVANVTSVYVSAGLIDASTATLTGGLSMALGVMTFSRRVMTTVGKSIIQLDAFSALIVVLAEALTVHAYAWVGVPVSTSQAVVGAVIGVGLVKQASALRSPVVRRIASGWLATPVIAAGVTVALHFVTHLHYIPA